MQELNICVVGAGDLGTQHAAQWQKVPGATIMAICDIDQERVLAAQQKFGIEAAYTDYREALSHPGIDAVSVAIPSCAHREVSEAAMRRGYHVLCEKPIALTLEDGEAMLTAAEECGVKFAVGFCKRFLEQIDKLQELIQGGAIGRPVMYRHISGIQVRPKQWIMDKQMGGGPIIDMACHYFDQWRLIFDSEPALVKASGVTLSTDLPLMADYDPQVDTVTILVEYESGDVGSLSLSWGLPEGISTAMQEDILGPGGLITLDGLDTLTVETAADHTKVFDSLGTNMLEPEVAAFAEAIREDKPVVAGGEDGLIALRVSLAALRSIETGQAVAL